MERDSMKGKAVVEAFERGIKVLTNGDVVGLSGKILKGEMHGNYRRVGIRVEGKKWTLFYVHSLVAYEKFGDKIFEPGMQVRHLNGNSLDNSWDNIGIGTASENRMDMTKEARVKSSKHANSFRKILSDKEVIEIRRLRKDQNLTYKTLMEMYPKIKSKGHLSDIINMKIYKDV